MHPFGAAFADLSEPTEKSLELEMFISCPLSYGNVDERMIDALKRAVNKELYYPSRISADGKGM